MDILVFNCGSSSIKYQLFDMKSRSVLAKGAVTRIGEARSEAVLKAGGKVIEHERPIADHDEALQLITAMLTDADQGPLKSMSEVHACGHRIVHGGEDFSGSVMIDDSVIAAIERRATLAPLHNPANLTGVRAAMHVMPGVPQVACFDTAFHQTIPPEAYRYAIPHELYEDKRIRKYGFHGTSHRYVAQRAAEMIDKPLEDTRFITCHLGNGCSIAAIKGGKSIDTSMGLTPLEGLVMGTRCGDLDPAVLFFLGREGYSLEDLDKLCNKQSGLLGISGISNDMRDLEAAMAQGNERARLAVEVFVYRIRKYIGAYLVALNGCDAIVFTAGIGENGPLTRERVCKDLDGLGIILDKAKNEACQGRAAELQTSESRVKILVTPTDEEVAIAEDTYQLTKKD